MSGGLGKEGCCADWPSDPEKPVEPSVLLNLYNQVLAIVQSPGKLLVQARLICVY